MLKCGAVHRLWCRPARLSLSVRERLPVDSAELMLSLPPSRPTSSRSLARATSILLTFRRCNVVAFSTLLASMALYASHPFEC
jgi:hypothetical protein